MSSATSAGASAATVSYRPFQCLDGMLSRLIAAASASLGGERATTKDCVRRARIVRLGSLHPAAVLEYRSSRPRIWPSGFLSRQARRRVFCQHEGERQ
jgi:hypothetical protein